VFYGPKVDVKLYDSLGRGWQGPTIQLDFNLPQRFEAGYIGPDGGEHQVVMIHRTVLGSMERFVACLTEHYGGAFPVWLSPTQAVIIPIADRHIGYARGMEEELKGRGVRVEVDARSERMNLKIREAILQRIPYILVVGDKEERAGTVSLRLRSGEDLGSKTLPELWQIIQPELKPCS
jgi:threonyl-tRNA synthetase